jgi:hypothetical protein
MTPIQLLNETNIHDVILKIDEIQGYEKEKRTLAIFIARMAQDYMPAKFLEAFNIAERHINGLATDEELRNGIPTEADLSEVFDDIVLNDLAATGAFAAYDAAIAAYECPDVYGTTLAVIRNKTAIARHSVYKSIEAKFRELFEEK